MSHALDGRVKRRQVRHPDPWDRMRVGIGYDIHPLAAGRSLVLGGVRIPWTKGLEGHSDADCLTHAIVDALLGAVGQGDIGRRFGVRRRIYRKVSSLVFARDVRRQLARGGWRVNNVDATIVCEAPRLGPYRAAMQIRLARALGIEPARVNVKATTAKRLWLLGASQAIAVMAVVSAIRRES